jgi:hypothetical protein
VAEVTTRTHWHGVEVPKITRGMVSTLRWLLCHADVVRAAHARGASEAEIADAYEVSPAEQRRIVRAAR